MGRSRREVCAGLALAALCASRSAHGNGRFPQAQMVVVGPGRNASTIFLRTTFGLIVSDDGAAHFRYLCEDAFDVMDGVDPAIALNADGALLVGLPDGLAVARDRCTTGRQDELQGQSVRDLATDVSGRVVFAALTSRDAVPVSRIARSDDGGGHFTLSTDGMRGVVLDTVEVAPSLPTRVYATGSLEQGGAVRVYASDDGGARWRIASELAGAAGAYVSAVDPTRPEVVWVRVTLADAPMDAGAWSAADGPSALLRSDDGAVHFREVARTRGPMRGFALSDDGRTVWVGGPDARDGLLRSDDGGGSFARVATASVECLRQHAGALYVCETYRPHGVMLGRSMDGGATIVPALTFDGLEGPPRCAASTRVGAVCGLRWPGVRALIAPEGPRDAGGMDAAQGVDSGPSAPTDCHCVAARPVRKSGAWWLATLVALAFWRRSRSRPARPRRR